MNLVDNCAANAYTDDMTKAKQGYDSLAEYEDALAERDHYIEELEQRLRVAELKRGTCGVAGVTTPPTMIEMNAYDGDERRLTGNERQRRIINEQEGVIRLMRGTINLIESEVAELRAAEPCHWSARTGEMIDRQHARAKALKS